jgi:hypothetical protein
MSLYNNRHSDLHAKANNSYMDRFKPKTRMAQEEVPKDVSDLIDVIRNEDGEQALELAIQDATSYLNRQYGIEDQFIDAGLSPKQARMVEALEELKGKGVPSAFIHSPQQGLEQRVHTKYATNPFTEQQEIVPYTVNGSPLVTNFGRNVPMNGHQKATEYVQEQAMLLAGLPVQRNNTSDIYAPDFRIGNQTVDGEIRTASEGQNLPIQLYTKIVPNGVRGVDEHAVKQIVGNAIAERAPQYGNIPAAVSSLYRDGNFRTVYDGKLLNQRPGKVVDNLIMPTLTNQEARANKNANDRIAISPQELRMVNMNAVKDVLNDMPVQEQLKRLQSRGNTGDGGGGEPRSRLYIRVDQNAPGVSYDMADRHPHVAQILAQ